MFFLIGLLNFIMLVILWVFVRLDENCFEMFFLCLLFLIIGIFVVLFVLLEILKFYFLIFVFIFMFMWCFIYIDKIGWWRKFFVVRVVGKNKNRDVGGICCGLF